MFQVRGASAPLKPPPLRGRAAWPRCLAAPPRGSKGALDAPFPGGKSGRNQYGSIPGGAVPRVPELVAPTPARRDELRYEMECWLGQTLSYVAKVRKGGFAPLNPRHRERAACHNAVAGG
jgi:hypothetical protein